MSRRGAALALLAGGVAFELGYTATSWFALPVPLYLPLARAWCTQPTTELAMDWYGRLAFAIVCGLGVGLLTYALRRRRDASDESVTRWTAWLATALALALGMQVFQLARRAPHPEPLPADYQAR